MAAKHSAHQCNGVVVRDDVPHAVTSNDERGLLHMVARDDTDLGLARHTALCHNTHRVTDDDTGSARSARTHAHKYNTHNTAQEREQRPTFRLSSADR